MMFAAQMLESLASEGLLSEVLNVSFIDHSMRIIKLHLLPNWGVTVILDGFGPTW
jgi:hypothetical protein